MTIKHDVRRRFQLLVPALNERTRRLWAAAEAKAMGRGGVSAVARATGVSRRAIACGLLELDDRRALASDRVRQPSAGRKRLIDTDPKLPEKLDRLVEPTARGDPMSPLRWTCKSVRNLADELTAQHHRVSYRTVAHLLNDMGYSLQSNRKNTEGADHPDRDGQFRHVARCVRAEQAAGTKNWRGQPLLSHAAIVNLIASTRTAVGLKVTCRLDMRRYPSGVKVSDEQTATLRITPDRLHGEWNYTIHPREAGR